MLGKLALNINHDPWYTKLVIPNPPIDLLESKTQFTDSSISYCLS